jgi:hypothetical protein
VTGLQATLAAVSLGNGWPLIGFPGWVWLIAVVPEAALLLALSGSLPRHRLEQMGLRRTVALVLVGVITAADAFALVALTASLLTGHEKSGGELLLKGATIWGTNMITFGLLLWEFDRGGPTRRREPDPPPRDFQFPQDEPDTCRTGLAPVLCCAGREHSPLTPMAARAAQPMRFDASRFAAVYRAPGRQRRPAIWFTHLADAGPPAATGERSFSSQSWRQQ